MTVKKKKVKQSQNSVHLRELWNIKMKIRSGTNMRIAFDIFIKVRIRNQIKHMIEITLNISTGGPPAP